MKFLYLGEYSVIKILVVTRCMVSSIIIDALYGYSVASTIIVIVSMSHWKDMNMNSVGKFSQ